MDADYKQIALKVKAYFAAQNISINDAAARVGVSPQSLTSALSGRDISYKTAKKLADAFGFSVEYLLTGEGELIPGTSPAQAPEEPTVPLREYRMLVDTICSQQRTIASLVEQLTAQAPTATPRERAEHYAVR